MAHLLFHVREGFALLNQQTRKGMTQVVDADMPQACLCQGLHPHVTVKIALIEGRAETPVKSQSRTSPQPLRSFSFLRSTSTPLSVSVSCKDISTHRPFPLLRGGQPVMGQRAPHLDKAPLKVNITPL